MISSARWDSLDTAKYRDEDAAIAQLLAGVPLYPQARDAVLRQAVLLVEATRNSGQKKGLVESFLQEFSLRTEEGLVLMGLAESLLRIPDTETRNRLIAENIGAADWAAHIGQSESLLVNASTWSLMLTGKLVALDLDIERNPAPWIARLARRVGEPVVRQAITAAVRMMGEQFVLGRTIDAALARARRESYRCSFDMLGEGARTAQDAERYERLYKTAIDAVGDANAMLAPAQHHSISVKLSALSPRYEAVQEASVWTDLYPRLLRLVTQAASRDVAVTIDAEEADRLVLSIKLLDRLAHEPALAGWTGLGMVVQAYQKRALDVVAALTDLAKSSGRLLNVRLVKGAYWDSEIKRAQISGRPDYPVFTTKAATDLSYLACARALTDAAPMLRPQFATHNAHTLAAVHCMATEAGVEIEYQRLHGMGEGLYRSAETALGSITVRAYAPVGGHEDLLPYLVRRLMENGANSSFVHVLHDPDVPAVQVAADPIAVVEAAPHRHPRIPLPRDLYGPARRNPLGRDYNMAEVRAEAGRAARDVTGQSWISGPMIGGTIRETGVASPLKSPVDGGVVGNVFLTNDRLIDEAVARARHAQPGWEAAGGRARAAVLRAIGDALEGDMDRLVALLAREGGKTLNDGVAEVREAADFCRYYAQLAQEQFGGPSALPGPVGEANSLELKGRGVFACISPWNFPLAIFCGQIAAALAAGNAVVAKPAEQTPLIAAQAVQLFLGAGLNPDLLALLTGEGETVGARLVTNSGVDGVAFTGGTETAWAINRAIAARDGPIIPFIAETGGLNAMFADTTALTEQLVDDILQSAFASAGQRCSALRLLFVPHASADKVISTLIGAMDRLVVGDPADPATDIGPVIDSAALEALQAHVGRLNQSAKVLYQVAVPPGPGHYFGPVVAEIPAPDYVQTEVFGPILHIYRYGPGELETVAKALAAKRYGLTLGIHSRLDSFAAQVRELVPAGNCYINRSMVGAVVGVQPFGGEGLSGTGPKAGGPHALLRHAVERAVSDNISARGGDPALLNL